MKKQQKVVFLDRDGVLIHDVHYLSELQDILFYPDVPKGLCRLKDAGYILVVVTNQSGVARGYFPESFVIECHQEMNRILKQHSVQIDYLYYCPHHIDGKPPLDKRCQCRKPNPELVFRAEQEHQLDLASAYMIGDKHSDMGLAVNANIRGILLTTGQGKNTVHRVMTDFPGTSVFSSFQQAVDHILLSSEGG